MLAKARRTAGRRGTNVARKAAGNKRPIPSTAPYSDALALEPGDVAEVQECIDTAPTYGDLAQLASAATEIEQPHTVTLRGSCAHCGKRVVLQDSVTIPALVGVAARLRALRDKLAQHDIGVLRRLLGRLNRGASLWFTGKGE